jgi:spoIIIJ-associated protein
MAQELIHDGKLDRQATAEALRQFLESMVRAAGLELKVTVRAISAVDTGGQGDAEVLADLDGRDKEILLEHGADVLKALEHLAFKALRLEPAFHEKVHIDSGGYRALRFEELKMTARVAAERVQTSRQPFRLNPMSSRERRIVHLALKEMTGVRTESIGVGEERQVVIHPADSKPARSLVQLQILARSRAHQTHHEWFPGRNFPVNKMGLCLGLRWHRLKPVLLTA